MKRKFFTGGELIVCIMIAFILYSCLRGCETVVDEAEKRGEQKSSEQIEELKRQNNELQKKVDELIKEAEKTRPAEEVKND